MVVHMIANAHLDPVWLWNWQAGVDEVISTFRSAADRCDEYEDFTYTRGEAWCYEWIERMDPTLFARIENHIASGRWSIAGGQFIQPDCNLPTEAGWHKQFELGQAYFNSRFGHASTIGYNVDSFGHTATLPDLLQQHNCRGYVFHRPSPERVPLPAQTFIWKGCQGNSVIGFRIAGAYVTRADELYGQIKMAVEAADSAFGHTLCFFGLGNHGGGPSKACIEWLLQHRHSFPDLEIRFGTLEEFFDIAEEKRHVLPEYSGELQRTFPGCYSVMHRIKQQQHRGERFLEQAEDLNQAFALNPEEKAKTTEALDTAWRDLAFTQFHDVLAGTSIPSAWPSIEAMQGRARIIGEEQLLSISRRHARQCLPAVNQQQWVIMHGGDQAFEGYVEHEPFIDFDDWNNRVLVDEEGRQVPFQLVEAEALMGKMMHRVLIPLKIPAKSCRLLQLKPAELLNGAALRPMAEGLGGSPTEADNHSLQSGSLQAAIGSRGISSLKWNDTNLLGEGGLSFHCLEDLADTWVFHQTAFEGDILAESTGFAWTLEETGPLRSKLYGSGQVGTSIVRVTASMYQGLPEIHLQVQLHFMGEQQAIRMDVELPELPLRWCSGLAGGEVDRQPGPDEMPFLGWDAIQLSNQALTLHTPDAYSVRLQQNRWQFLLARSPYMAWAGQPGISPKSIHRVTDQGVHEYSWILRVDPIIDPALAHRRCSEQVKEPVSFDRYEGLNRPPWRNAPPRRLWTPDIIVAREDGHMKHLDAVASTGKNWEEN